MELALEQFREAVWCHRNRDVLTDEYKIRGIQLASSCYPVLRASETIEARCAVNVCRLLGLGWHDFQYPLSSDDILCAAQKGDSWAWIYMGWYRHKFDYTGNEILSCYQKAAYMGNPEGYYELGRYCVSRGYNKADAKYALTEATRMGHSEAPCLLGKIDFDEEKALQWFHIAVDRGSVDAYYYLAHLYAEFREDRYEAAKWTFEGVAHGNEKSRRAMLRASFFYELSSSVQCDRTGSMKTLDLGTNDPWYYHRHEFREYFLALQTNHTITKLKFEFRNLSPRIKKEYLRLLRNNTALLDIETSDTNILVSHIVQRNREAWNLCRRSIYCFLLCSPFGKDLTRIIAKLVHKSAGHSVWVKEREKRNKKLKR